MHDEIFNFENVHKFREIFLKIFAKSVYFKFLVKLATYIIVNYSSPSYLFDWK